MPQTLIKICALLTPVMYSSISESVTNLNLFTVQNSNGIRIYRDTCKCNGCAVFCIVVIFYTNKDIPNQHKMFMINRRHLKAANLYHSSQASRNQLAHVSHPRRTPQTFLGKVQRWTKSEGPVKYILDCDKIFVPIHQVRKHEEQCAKWVGKIMMCVNTFGHEGPIVYSSRF